MLSKNCSQNPEKYRKDRLCSSWFMDCRESEVMMTLTLVSFYHNLAKLIVCLFTLVQFFDNFCDGLLLILLTETFHNLTFLYLFEAIYLFFMFRYNIFCVLFVSRNYFTTHLYTYTHIQDVSEQMEETFIKWNTSYTTKKNQSRDLFFQ